MRPFFSVIIPAYNSEKFIRKGLDSIRAQSFTDYELIVVCDSCADQTEAIAKDYGAITRNVNFGLDGLTRNVGIEMAAGQWTLFMDDDDWFLHEFVFEMLAGMVGKHDEDAVMFGFISRDSEYAGRAGCRGYNFSTPDNCHVPVWSKCWRTEFIKDLKFSNRHYWSDCDFQNAAFRKPHKFVYWNMPLYYYNYHRKGSQSQKRDEGEVIPYGGKPAHVILSEDWRKRE